MFKPLKIQAVSQQVDCLLLSSAYKFIYLQILSPKFILSMRDSNSTYHFADTENGGYSISQKPKNCLRNCLPAWTDFQQQTIAWVKNQSIIKQQ